VELEQQVIVRVKFPKGKTKTYLLSWEADYVCPKCYSFKSKNFHILPELSSDFSKTIICQKCRTEAFIKLHDSALDHILFSPQKIKRMKGYYVIKIFELGKKILTKMSF